MMRILFVLFAAAFLLGACSADDFSSDNRLHESDPGTGGPKVPPSARGRIM